MKIIINDDVNEYGADHFTVTPGEMKHILRLLEKWGADIGAAQPALALDASQAGLQADKSGASRQ